LKKELVTGDKFKITVNQENEDYKIVKL